MSKSRGILFSAPMIRAIRRKVNPKTVTRRLVKPQPVRASIPGAPGPETAWPWRTGIGYVIRSDSHGPPPEWAADCPYGQPGDTLWVRESYRFGAEWDDTKPSEVPQSGLDLGDVYYEADGLMKRPEDNGWGKLRPGMFMPRWASRITLEIASVRAERLHEITFADCRAEGCDPDYIEHVAPCVVCDGGDPCNGTHTGEKWHYSRLWESINGAGSWASNPWVWRIEFRRVTA